MVGSRNRRRARSKRQGAKLKDELVDAGVRVAKLEQEIREKDAELAKVREARDIDQSHAKSLRDFNTRLNEHVAVLQKNNRVLEERLENAQRWRLGALALADAVHKIGERDEVPF